MDFLLPFNCHFELKHKNVCVSAGCQQKEYYSYITSDTTVGWSGLSTSGPQHWMSEGACTFGASAYGRNPEGIQSSNLPAKCFSCGCYTMAACCHCNQWKDFSCKHWVGVDIAAGLHCAYDRCRCHTSSIEVPQSLACAGSGRSPSRAIVALPCTMLRAARERRV